ncbi:MAG: hypothetical protein HND44_03600 [Chloroflexi bacterium]|nr:hypothetical protein [Ardenticatenaceae bacterium]MBL1127584.1 hypothetical protein [Chloroflexota bacterium]NOG33649.1 hypothetical protein [Chloroflexota bacterium]GIK56607.1 MAG: hypothetical protein BroJett015_22700 [Chloroflexota bacterium]
MSAQIEIKLSSLEEMFAEPAADPFDPDSRYLSGIDEVVGQLRLKWRELDETTRLLIRLPQTAVTANTAATLKAALDRYGAAQIAQNQQAIEELRVGSHRETLSAIVIVTVLIILTILLVNLIPELEQVSGALAGFVGIAVWVIF